MNYGKKNTSNRVKNQNSARNKAQKSLIQLLEKVF